MSFSIFGPGRLGGEKAIIFLQANFSKTVTALFLSLFQFRGFKVIFAPLKLVKKIILNII